MAQLIELLVLFFLLGMVWGAVVVQMYVKMRIKQGKLPKFLMDKRDSLLPLLK